MQSKSNKSEKIYNEKYIKLSKIGGGSFGQVYLVKDIKTNKEYAMKKFYLDNLGKKEKLNKGKKWILFDKEQNINDFIITKKIKLNQF